MDFSKYFLDISPESAKIYITALNKLEIHDINDSNAIIEKANLISNISTRDIVYSALCKLPIDTLPYIQERNKLQVLRLSTPKDMALPMSLYQLQNIVVEDKNPKKELVDRFFVYIHVKYPLRLDYYNVPIYYTEYNDSNTNYFIYKDNVLTFYLNKFKNVKSMSKQVFTYSDPVIIEYIDKMTEELGHKPTHLLYMYYLNKFQLFESRTAFGIHLTNIIRRATGHHITINTIRKIHETDLINSEEYKAMTIEEKEKAHKKLLHCYYTANMTYYIN
jgi:hypothetical protein